MGVILDTNILLLYFIGIFDKSYISTFKRTNKYSVEDYIILKRFVKRYKKIYVTPHILAELYNFADNMHEPKFSYFMHIVLNILSNHLEDYSSKEALSNNKKLLIKLGFTDLSIIEASKKNKIMIITDDKHLTNEALLSNLNVLNFTQLRGRLWLS